MNAKSKELLVFLQGNPLESCLKIPKEGTYSRIFPESDVSLNLSNALPHRTSP